MTYIAALLVCVAFSGIALTAVIGLMWACDWWKHG